jgi:Protein of unknown function (DUF2934)
MPVSKEDAVRELAYRLWAARGRQHGFDLQDWLDAERLIGDSEDDPGSRSDDSEPPIKVPNPPEDEVDDVIRETPKVASRDAPGG